MRQQFQLSDEDRIVTIYSYSSITGEFIGKDDTLIPAQTGLPAYCSDIVIPETHDGYVPVFMDNGWVLVEDHRAKKGYCTKSGTELLITELGTLPNDVTLQAPSTVFDCWNGSEWVRDEDKTAAIARYYRDTFLSATDAMMISDFSINDNPLTADKLTELIATRAAYRQWPTLDNWPLIELPELPQWLLVEAVNQGYRVPVWPI
ncbi:tail fiber assembly protein [Yersinia enterocolitica]|uniref:tail fiber assembly protein n=1 Tax=Yersinia enterocolitica TaxID=630 RepID=UPI0020B167EA|nr:tail fiber assembly protein [Yersinia enterocolitica]